MSLTLDAILSDAADGSPITVELSPKSSAVLLFAVYLLERRENWLDTAEDPLDEITEADWDAIEKIVANASYEIMTEVNTTMIGSIVMWASNTIPDEWLLCDGTSYLRTDYPELEILFPTGGSWGGSSSHFNVPDFRGRSPIMPTIGVVDNPGKITGTETHALTTPEIPAHNHAVTDPGHAHGEQVSGSPAYLSTGGSGRIGFGTLITSNLTRVNTDSATTGITTANTGDGAAHNNVHPVLGINFIIFAGV